jgi:hypothetical protein
MSSIFTLRNIRLGLKCRLHFMDVHSIRVGCGGGGGEAIYLNF